MSDLAISSVAPLLAVTSLSVIVLVIESLVTESERLSYWVTAAGLFGCTILSLMTMGQTGTIFNGMINVGGYGNFFAALFLSSALLTVILSRDYLQKNQTNFGEFYLLIIFSTIGMMLMA